MENNGFLSECIILAGGLGTRLQAAVPGIPKCLAPVGGRPFLYYLLLVLQEQGVQKFIFALGHRHEPIIEFVNEFFPCLRCTFVVEPQPLGTGGAIRHCLPYASAADVLIVNGDTLFTGNISQLAAFHTARKADCTLAVTYRQMSARYGAVQWEADGRITGFAEKGHSAPAHINAGVYRLSVEPFLQLQLPSSFSFETDYLQLFAPQKQFYALPLPGYFIDIGVPEDYERAQSEILSETGAAKFTKTRNNGI